MRLRYELQQLLGFKAEDDDKHYSKYGSSFKDIETEEKHSVSLLVTHDAFAVEASTPIDLRAGVHSLFLYSDIIKPNNVGDVYAHLLETVTVPNHSTFGDQCVISYKNPKFDRLVTNEFETINIDIKDDAGSDFKFQYGRVILKLLFRKWINII